MTYLDPFDRIAAAEVAIWSIFLIGGIFLCIRHGFSRSSGWVFLVLLSLARIIGSALRLATVNDPTNQSLYIGWAICSGLGTAMLVTVNIGLMSRLIASVRRSTGGNSLVLPTIQRLMKLTMMAAVILFIVGGTQAKWKTEDGGQPAIVYPTLSVVGLSLMLAILIISIFIAVYLLTVLKHIPQGEKRILAAVFAAFPFIIIRLAYSCTLIFGKRSPSAWFSLGTEVVTEMIAALIIEIMGFTLCRETKDAAPPRGRWYGRETETQYVQTKDEGPMSSV